MSNGRSLRHRLDARLRIEANLVPLRLSNLFQRRRIVDPDGDCVVSLTSFGRRVRRVYLAIESIGRGPALPARVILWLEDRDVVAEPPATLRRLMRRGLELRCCEDLGPHKKYFPYVSTQALQLPLVTADDDVIYPRDWLSGLRASHAGAPELLHCYRAHQIRFDDGRIAPYAMWSPCRSTEPSLLHFATGVSGVLYPLRLQMALRERGTSFLDKCPRADDVWLHATCVAEGIAIKQVDDAPADFPPVPGGFDSALMTANVTQGGNDKQVQATYTPEDLDRLRECYASVSPPADAR
jgi:hypothetical protein